MEIRVSPDGTTAAIKTGPGVTAGDWFVFHPDNGGGYTDGVYEGVDTWTPCPLPEQDNRKEQQ